MAGTTNAQYQHFVPQFLLRNFSHPYKPQDDDLKTDNPKPSKRSKRKYEKGKYPGDKVVRNLNLSMELPVICETPVNRILGKTDMYRDTSKPSPRQQHIEQMFSKLEGQAGAVFRKITKSFEKNDKEVCLTRDERDLIRKFLFLLKYRGISFHRRFYHDNVESYIADDREFLQEYMKEKDFERPIDVWFDNIKTIIELHMDPEGKWIYDLPKRMFPEDAEWFIVHAQCMYMAICTPNDPSDEFILTDNSYNVFEGPNTFVTDENSGRFVPAAYTPLHEFAPVSPKLMIVLRSFALPVSEEDAWEKVKNERDLFRSQILDTVYKDEVKSLLADFPIKKARNNYSAIINGRTELINGEDGTKRKHHKFRFTFFPIKTSHVDTINGILLDNAHNCTSVVFESIESFSRTLEYYLTEPRMMEKIVNGDHADHRLTLLNKLGTVSKSLGSTKGPAWKEQSATVMKSYEAFQIKKLEQLRLYAQMIKDSWKSNPETYEMQTYRLLDGSEETLLEDLEQSGQMWKLRIKIDVWSQGINESVRQRNRKLLIDAYLRLPPRRVFFYLQRFRFTALGYAARLEGQTQKSCTDFDLRGPEDTIARGKSLHIIKPQTLTQLMYKATANDIELKEPSERKFRAESAFGRIGVNYFMACGLFTLVEPRYIRDCGIDEIEVLAETQQLEVIKRKLYNSEKFRNISFDDGEKIELLTRIMVKSKFMEVLSGKLERSLLVALKHVFFEILYLIPTLDQE